MVVFTMVRVVWGDPSKVQVYSETSYGSETPYVMLGKYLWGNLHTHRIINEL